MDDSEGASDVSLLLDLSEEVLVHLVKLARFTLTDVGHLRATCKRLCDFLDRIRDTVVNDSVVGDLSRYRPYGYWDIDLAARSGHLEVIQLLHEDEVKRGRVTHCSNASTTYALQRGDLDVFVFIACNRREIVTNRGWYVEAGLWRLTRDQLVALLDRAPSFLASDDTAACDAAKAAIAMGDAALLGRLLSFVLPAQLAELTIDALSCEVLVHSVVGVLRDAQKAVCTENCEVEVSETLFMLAATAASVDALERAASRAPVAFGALPETAMESIATRAFQMGTDDVVLERLRGMAFEHAGAREWGTREWVLRTFGSDSGGLVSLLRRGRYDDADVMSRRLDKIGQSMAIGLLLHHGAIAALEWMRSKGYLGIPEAIIGMHVDALQNGTRADPRALPLEWQPMSHIPELHLTPEIVDVMLSIVSQQVQPCFGGTVVERVLAPKWYAHCFQAGDFALLRHVCERVDGLQIFSTVEAAVAAGHYDMVSYMLTAGHPGRLEPFEPFDLAKALATAVRAGHFRLATIIASRLPDARVSLSAAVQSRRWRLFHWALERGVTDEELRAGFLAALQDGRLDFVRWFETNRPDVVDWSVRSELMTALAHVRDMRFVRAAFERNPGVLVAPEGPAIPRGVTPHEFAGWLAGRQEKGTFGFGFAELASAIPKEAIPVNYDTFALERDLGIEIICRPFRVDLWARAGRRDVLQAALDFGVRTSAQIVRLAKEIPSAFGSPSNPYIKQWLDGNADKFVIG